MASGPLSASDSRKLRTIYQAIEHNNNKQALKLIKVFLEKHGDSQIGMALSSLALEREGRTTEAGLALDRLLALKPRDPQVINTATATLKALGRQDDLLALWTSAAEAEPANEELQAQLFFAHGRVNAHAKQYQLAGALYKTFKRPRYLHWMAGAAYLQWRASRGKDTLQLTLADKWAAKAAEETPLEQVKHTQLLEAVLFAVELQEAAGKHEAALSTLTRHQAAFRSEPAMHARIRSALLTKLGRHADALDAQRDVLRVAPDDWTAAAALVDAAASPEQREPLRLLLAELAQRADDAHRRGPLLATVLLHVSALERNQSLPAPDQLAAPLLAAIRAYLAYAAQRPCVLADLSLLLGRVVSVLPATQLPALAEELALDSLSGPELALLLPRSVDELPATLRPPPLSLAAARRLLSQYLALPAEQRPAHAALLLRAIRAATAAYGATPVARVTLLLMKLHQLAGSGLGAAEQINVLTLKHVQWFSMPYLFADETFELVVPPSAAQDVYRSIDRFAAASRREMPDLVTSPFRHESYSKLSEFVRMRERLERALNFAEAALDAALLAIADAPALAPVSVYLHTTPALAVPLTPVDVASMELVMDRSVLPALSLHPAEQTALLAPRFAAPEAWRRAVLVARSLVGPFLRHITASPVLPEPLHAIKAQATAAIAAIAATATTLAAHPLQRGARLLVHLIETTLLLLAAKEEETDEALGAAFTALHEHLSAGLVAWTRPHGWWDGERLGLARRWQAEEATWTAVAEQAWLKLVPRRAKAARAALKRAHSLSLERITRAVEAATWSAWPPPAPGAECETGDAELQAVRGAVEASQKAALAAVRASLTALRVLLHDSKP